MVEFAELTVVTEKPAPGPALGPQIKKNKTSKKHENIYHPYN